MSDAVGGLRIIELGSGPITGIAGMVLADFGAEVLRIEGDDDSALQALPAAPLWQRGKHALHLDLDSADDRHTFDELCAGADVLLTNWRASSLQRRGLDFDTLHAAHPHLHFCHITGYGPHGALADVPGYEHVAAAYAGRMRLFAGITDRAGPVFSAVQVGVHVAAQSAAAGILAATLQDTPGRRIETSLLQGMLPYEMGSMIGHQFAERYAAMMPLMQATEDPPLPSLFYHPAQAGDGRWMQFGNLLPHLFDNFLIATDLIDVVADPGFDPKQLLLRPEEKHEAFRARMLARIQERTSDAWMDHFIADGGIVAATYETTQQALSNPDVVANGHVIPRPDGGVELGPLARLSDTPAVPKPGLSQAPCPSTTWRASPRPTPGENETAAAPLHGIRVVELATIIAAPLGASFLADMGAEVIKIEQIGGDPFRGLLAGLGALRVNGGKQSVSVNLKSSDGVEIVQRLIDIADVLIHNYRPGVAERLGIGYEQMSARNPGLIYLQSHGYGPDGPSAQRPSTHPIPGAAMGGVMYQMGERLPDELLDFEGLRMWTSRLMRANELNPDPNTAVVVATSALLGLAARHRTGRGQRIIVDMFGANAYANADDFLSYPDKAPRPMPDEGLHGVDATYRLYPCADAQWVFLAIPTPTEQQAFIQALASAGIEAPDVALLAANDQNTAEYLKALFASRTADEWQRMLVAHGVACVRADGPSPAEFWLQDDHIAENGFVTKTENSLLGQYTRHGSLLHFDGHPPHLNGAPFAGEHNHAILGALGYDTEQIDALHEQGVLWREPISSVETHN